MYVNKMILLLPKPLLNKYILDHFAELSVEDFFQVAPKVRIPLSLFRTNEQLSRNGTVLNYMLDIDSRAFVYFKKDALSLECVNKIADSGIKIYPNEIEQYPQFLDNNMICENLINSFPKEIKRLSSNQITDRIISILEETNYIPDEEDIENIPPFLESEILLTRAVKNIPNLILKIENLSEQIVSDALRNGFIPQKQHFYSHPQFRMYEALLQKGFEHDPSIIVFLDRQHLTPNTVKSAQNRGYVADEKDLIENPDLRRLSEIMEPAIEKNPQLITLISEDCFLSHELIARTLAKYKITKEDIKKNPKLARNYLIIRELPEFKYYSAFLNNEEKEEALFNHFKNSNSLSIQDFPFLDYEFGGKSDKNKLTQLIEYLQLSFDEKDINVQENYFQMLDKVVDGIINMRYTQNKFSFKYPDIVFLNDSLIKLFQNVSTTKDFDLLSQFSDELYQFVGETIPIDQIENEITKFYNIYLERQTIDLSTTNEFCNKILNQHRNHFMSTEKEKILNKIKSQMSLTEKKKNTILNGKKIQKIGRLIGVKGFEQLGITEEQFRNALENTKKSILNNKDIKKSGIQITDSQLDLLITSYRYYGKLTPNIVTTILGIDNNEITKFIVNKFEQIKFKWLNNVTLTPEESFIYGNEKDKLTGLNPNNYIIGDKNRYYQNIAELLIKLDDQLLNKILTNKAFIKEVVDLLPLVNLVEELDVNAFINILSDYERIRNKLFGTTSPHSNIAHKELILHQIDELISLANAYSSLDDITLFTLGRNVVAEVGEPSSPKYLEFYLKMLERQSGNIPPVSVETSKYYLESGNYSDEERLLIGKKPSKNSCIDLLNSAGMETYNEVLLQGSGDVILIRDKQKNVLSRILIFRRGNVVQMITRSGETYPIELYQEVADQIIQQSISTADNIDYVFVNSSSSSLPNDSYRVVQDKRFINSFSHADFTNSAILLRSKNSVKGYEEGELNLNFEEPPKASYMKPRKEISYKPTETEITRLRVLNIALEPNLEEKENKSRELEPFYLKDYEKVICGENWYIAVKQDGTLEELILPSTDDRTYEEIRQVQELLGLDTSAYKKL